MKRSFSVVAAWICVMGALLAADGPERKPQLEKPPWQRLLQGRDAKEAAEMEIRAVALQLVGDIAEALKVAETLAQLRAKAQGPDHWEAVNARLAVEAMRQVLRAKKEEQQSYCLALGSNLQADALEAKGQHLKAQPLYERVLSIRRKVLGEENLVTATSYSSVAKNLAAQGKYKQAGESYGRALSIRRKVLGEEHPNTAASYSGLALSLNSQGKYQQAEKNFRKALAIYRKELGEGHPNAIATSSSLALSLNCQEKFREAEESMRKALAISSKVLGEEHPHTALCYNYLAASLEGQSKYKEAEGCWNKALAIFRKITGEEDPDTADVLVQLGVLHLKQKKFTDAEPLLRQCLTIRQQKQPDEWRTFNTRSALGQALLGQKKFAEAEPMLVQGYEGMKKREGKIPHAWRQIRLNEALERLVGLYEATEQKEKADYWRKKLRESRAEQEKSVREHR